MSAGSVDRVDGADVADESGAGEAAGVEDDVIDTCEMDYGQRPRGGGGLRTGRRVRARESRQSALNKGWVDMGGVLRCSSIHWSTFERPVIYDFRRNYSADTSLLQ